MQQFGPKLLFYNFNVIILTQRDDSLMIVVNWNEMKLVCLGPWWGDGLHFPAIQEKAAVLN